METLSLGLDMIALKMLRPNQIKVLKLIRPVLFTRFYIILTFFIEGLRWFYGYANHNSLYVTLQPNIAKRNSDASSSKDAKGLDKTKELPNWILETDHISWREKQENKLGQASNPDFLITSDLPST